MKLVPFPTAATLYIEACRQQLGTIMNCSTKSLPSYNVARVVIFHVCV